MKFARKISDTMYNIEFRLRSIKEDGKRMDVAFDSMKYSTTCEDVQYYYESHANIRSDLDKNAESLESLFKVEEEQCEKMSPSLYVRQHLELLRETVRTMTATVAVVVSNAQATEFEM